jgi:ligand-binding sensor domain-containing protein
MKYDKEGNLWLTNAKVNNGIKVLKSNNTWQSYNLNNIVQNPKGLHYGNIDIDKNGTKWIASYAGGVIAFNEKYNNKYIIINEENGNLPNNDVRCVAVDNRNQLWIGTFKGLRIINSIDRFVTENELSTTNIVIQEGDLAQELFYQQVIQDIKVDGSNNKWVAIADAGVFQVSPNGQTTIRRFTKENSPLPSNNVLDIEIDEVSGEVFFATDKGLVSYLGSSTRGDDDLQNVYAYPNPVRPGYTGTVKISGLMDKVNLKITDIEGNLVFETTSSGGTVEWDTTAFGKYKVASGVYMVFVTSSDAAETTVKKIMVVR